MSSKQHMFLVLYVRSRCERVDLSTSSRSNLETLSKTDIRLMSSLSLAWYIVMPSAAACLRSGPPWLTPLNLMRTDSRMLGRVMVSGTQVMKTTLFRLPLDMVRYGRLTTTQRGCWSMVPRCSSIVVQLPISSQSNTFSTPIRDSSSDSSMQTANVFALLTSFMACQHSSATSGTWSIFVFPSWLLQASIVNNIIEPKYERL